ncbi:MAG TPA: hypothetical protein VGJ84_07955 [Polyangiaceae bacterium]
MAEPTTGNPSPAPERGPRVSNMPWQNTGSTATGGVLFVLLIMALPLLLAVGYFCTAKSTHSVTPATPTQSK